MKIHPVGAELFHADRRTYGQTNMTELIVAFSNFANAPKTTILHILCCSDIYVIQMIQQNNFHFHTFIVSPGDGSRKIYRNIMF